MTEGVYPKNEGIIEKHSNAEFNSPTYGSFNPKKMLKLTTVDEPAVLNS
jgi:hypothetical protein